MFRPNNLTKFATGLKSRTGIPWSLAVPALFFVLALTFLVRFGGYLFFFQEQEQLFLYSPEYLATYLDRPGGLLEYAGVYLTQFYIHPAAGPVILSVVLTLPAVIVRQIGKRPGFHIISLPVMTILPSCILLLMQAHYYHFMTYNLGVLLILIFFLFALLLDRWRLPAALLLFSVLYYAGGAYAWIFLGMMVVRFLTIEKGIRRWLFPVLLTVWGYGVLVLFRELLFLQPLEELLRNPLPLVEVSAHRMLLYLLAVYLVLILPGVRLISRLNIEKTAGWAFSTASVLVVFVLVIFMLHKIYSPSTARVFQLQKYITGQQWEEAISLHETSPSRNLIGQFFYNVALSETGRLSDRLFSGRQDFGPRTLILPWGDVHMNRGIYFYYSIGLINEAHRWAYESMVVYGYRPQNMKFLVKCNLINGNFRMAEKYISILKQSRNYREWAEVYEELLYRTDEIRAHPDLGARIDLQPEKDFFIETEFPQQNIFMLVDANRRNAKAFEYKLAWLLLAKDVEGVVRLLPDMEVLGYTRLPVHVEEAVLVYPAITGSLPDPGNLQIRGETGYRFQQYQMAYSRFRQNPSANRDLMNRFQNTFWYHYHFQ